VVGESRPWLVLAVDAPARRISLTPPVEGYDPSSAPTLEIGAEAKGKVQRIEKYGVFVWLGPGRVGLMPNELTGAPRGADLARRYPVGSEVEVEVRDLADDGKRIRLARKGVTEVQERRPRREPRRPRESAPAERPKPAEDAPAFGTSLADKLRAALGQGSDRS
jgi:ribosomal protein S1